MKIIMSGFGAVDARGKIGGHVASKNRSGAYVRTKVSPVNPQSNYQQAARGRLGAMASGWRGLTDAQRQSFIDAAPSFPVFDVFGQQKILSGFQLYVQLNINLALAGQSAITSAPAPASIASLVSCALVSDLSSTLVSITCGLAAVPAGFSALVFATPLYGAGKAFVKNKMRFIQTIAAAATLNPTTSYASWNARFGTLVVGQKITVRIFLVSNTTGQAGVPFSATTTVVA
jgi:hypothetical protein